MNLKCWFLLIIVTEEGTTPTSSLGWYHVLAELSNWLVKLLTSSKNLSKFIMLNDKQWLYLHL